jgi:hypothetical protein
LLIGSTLCQPILYFSVGGLSPLGSLEKQVP